MVMMPTLLRHMEVVRELLWLAERVSMAKNNPLYYMISMH